MSKAPRKTAVTETDNAYFLKLVVYFILGLIWVKINGMVVLPVGLIIGVLIAQHEHFAIDRKIEYAVLLISAVVGLIGYGAYISIWFAQ